MSDGIDIASALGVKKSLDEQKPDEAVKRPKAHISDFHITQRIGDTWVRCGFAFKRNDNKGYNLYIRDMTNWKFRKLYMLKNRYSEKKHYEQDSNTQQVKNDE